MVRKNFQDLIAVLDGPDSDKNSSIDLEAIDESAFGFKASSLWIDRKKKEVDHLINLFRAVDDAHIVKSNLDYQSAKASTNRNVPLLILAIGDCLRINSDFLRSLETSIKTKEFEKFEFDGSEWYEDEEFIEICSSKIQNFLNFVGANKGFSTPILVTCDVPELRKCQPGTVLLYDDEKLHTFVFPPRMESPKIESCSHSTITISWKEPSVSRSIEGYMVYYRLVSDDETMWETKSVKKIESCDVDKLLADSEYIFKIAILTKAGKGTASEPSKTVRTRPPPSLAQKMIPSCIQICELEGRQVSSFYKLPLQLTYHDAEKRLRRFEVGEHHPTRFRNKVLLLVGATGAGKTTLINGLTNFLYGVNYEDAFRLLLVTEDSQVNQAHSQTTYITAYTFNWYPDALLPYSLTIVDTPGYGDTRGVEHDVKITEQVKDFFNMKGPDGITHLDCICFVAQSSLVRLTPSQEYIFDSILKVFGNDVGENICLMVTFADDEVPPLLEAVNGHSLPYVQYYSFNKLIETPVSNSDSKKKESGGFDRMYWDLSMKSFKLFFDDLDQMIPTSLVLTRLVLTERFWLEQQVESFEGTITKGLYSLSRVKEELLLMQSFYSEKEANKDFTVTRKELRTRKKNFKNYKRNVTNCLTCQTTCEPYSKRWFSSRERCTVMDEKGNCKVCIRHCSHQDHVNGWFTFEQYEAEVTCTMDDIHKKYIEASGKLANNHQLVLNMLEEYDKIQKDFLRDIEAVLQTFRRLDLIAMKPDSFTTEEYLRTLLKRETSEESRNHLEKLLRRTILIQEMSQSEKAYDPFKDLRDEIAQYDDKTMPESIVKKLLATISVR